MKQYSIFLSAARMMGLVSGCGSATGGEEVSTVITMDVNPSIQMRLNRDDAVVSVIGENKEAEEILKDMDLEQTDMTVAVNAVIGSMVKQGYLTTDNNTVLLSVENDDADERSRVEKELSENISSTLSTYDISGAILAQDMDIDDDMETIVNKYDISYGKAALIEEILEERSDYQIEDLVKLSAQELILIYESVDDDRDVSKMTGTVSTSKYITRDEALNIALSITRGHIGSLVVELFALAQTDLHLHPRTLKVHGKRNERITDGFGKAKKPHDLALVHEQTAHPHGIAVKDVALLIRADMAAV